MTPNPQSTITGSLKKRLQGLVFFRLLFAILFLGTTIWTHFKELKSALQPALYPFYGIIVFVCILTIVYAFLLKVIKNYKRFTYIQLFLDTVIITFTVFITGGIESPFSFLYILSIISGSILLNRQGGLVVASLSSLSYGLLIDLQFYNLFPWQLSIAPDIPASPAGFVLYAALMTIASFFTVAVLGGYLAERISSVERELTTTKIDYRRLERLSQSIIENVGSGILTCDRMGRITSFNKAAERITGFNLVDVYYKDIGEIFPNLKGFFDMKKGDEGRSLLRHESVFKKNDGSELYLGFSISTLRDDKGEDSGAVVIFQDLTQSKKMEEEFRRDDRLRALGELAAGMAHEIRNPLASISGSIQVLKEAVEGLNDEERRLMEIILMETERLNSLVADFLVFAKPALKKRTVNLKDITENTITLFFSRKGLKEIEILRDIKEVFISADPDQLRQVLWNLFMNAVEAMAGKGLLKVSVRKVSEGNCLCSAEIMVTDSGRGIEKDRSKRIFDPFFTTKEGGTGLGLAVVYRVVEGHDGTIEFDSERGKGTTFRILLPILD